jgi:hypothetical protein
VVQVTRLGGEGAQLANGNGVAHGWGTNTGQAYSRRRQDRRRGSAICRPARGGVPPRGHECIATFLPSPRQPWHG